VVFVVRQRLLLRFSGSFTKEEIAKRNAYHNYKTQEVQIEEMSGISVFYKNAAGDVFHTYTTYGRGAEDSSVRTCACI
jgi:predicted dithiol-disulfide oxidoreductase (DUF899 family)